MRLNWVGHACFLLEGSKRVLIDPFMPEGALRTEPDMVAVTHAHADHLGIFSEEKAVAIAELAAAIKASAGR